MTHYGVVERRPLAIVALGIPDGKGDTALVDYEDRIYELFPAALRVSGSLRVRVNGVFYNARRRSGPWLISSISVPLEIQVYA